jgi:hypothetical protein
LTFFVNIRFLSPFPFLFAKINVPIKVKHVAP